MARMQLGLCRTRRRDRQRSWREPAHGEGNAEVQDWGIAHVIVATTGPGWLRTGCRW